MMGRGIIALPAAAGLLAGCQQPAAVQPVAAVPQAVAVQQAIAPVAGAAVAAPAQEQRVLLTVRFRLNSHEIDRASMPVLANLARALSDERLRGAQFEVNGHTDASGKLGHNIALSFLRASAVVDQLHARGLRHATIRAQGFGPLQPINPSEPFDPGNRRVEVVAIGP